MGAFDKARKFFTEEAFIPWGKGGGMDTLADSLKFINGKVQDVAQDAAAGVRKLLLEDAFVPWGKQQVDAKGNRLKNEDGTDRVDYEPLANSLSVTNGAAIDARNSSAEAVEILKRIEAKLNALNTK